MPGKIFINYRRGDDPGFAQALFARLEQAFPPESLFMDVDSIKPGVDFVRLLADEVTKSDVMLSIIAKGWIEARDTTGARRLDNPDDYVRLEIKQALEQGKRVIPVLFGDARFPRPDELPEDIRPLATRNAVRLTHERFRAEAESLVKVLQEALAETESLRNAQAEKQEKEPVPALPLPDKPSIAVLPFINMSGDPEQEYFTDGIVEEIITALSRFRQLFVIARNSTFTFKGRAEDVKQVGRELGVRYVLEGSVRKSANRVRITGRLVDASTGAHLWADRFDGSLEDIFDLQDRITESVVGAIVPKLEQAEIERAKRKPTDNLDAYDYFLRALASGYHRTREGNDDALRLLHRAVQLDPNFASAYGLATNCYSWRKSNAWMTDSAQEIAETARLAWRAIELGSDDAEALCWAGFSLAYIVRDLDNGAPAIDRALVLNPNLAVAWMFRGWASIYLGEPEAAIEPLTHAMRLSPLDRWLSMMQAGIAFAHFFAGRYDEAAAWAEKSLQDSPNYHTGLRIASASNALIGRMQQVRKAMARLRQIDPTLRIVNLGDLTPVRRADDLARYEEGLRKAGLPE